MFRYRELRLMLPGPGVLPTFLYYFASTSLIVTIVLIKGTGLSAETGIPYTVATVAGVITGLLGTYFNRTIQIDIASKNPAEIQQTLTSALETLGYQPQADDDFADYTVFVRDGWSKVFSSRVFVKVEGNGAAIAGRATMMRRLSKQLDFPA